MKSFRKVVVTLAVGVHSVAALPSADAQVRQDTRRPAAPTASDSAQFPRVLSAALGVIRNELPIGERVYLDRTIIDTTRRMAPPLVSLREHKAPADWSRGHRVETAQHDVAGPFCSGAYIGCRLPSGVYAVVAMSEPFVRGNQAHVVVRHTSYVGESATRVITTVEEMTFERIDGDWKVANRRIRATT